MIYYKKIQFAAFSTFLLINFSTFQLVNLSAKSVNFNILNKK